MKVIGYKNLYPSVDCSLVKEQRAKNVNFRENLAVTVPDDQNN